MYGGRGRGREVFHHVLDVGAVLQAVHAEHEGVRVLVHDVHHHVAADETRTACCVSVCSAGRREIRASMYTSRPYP